MTYYVRIKKILYKDYKFLLKRVIEKTLWLFKNTISIIQIFRNKN